MARAKPMAAPLTVSGLSAPLADALTKAAAKAGGRCWRCPPGPLGTFPPQTLRPGSAVAVGLLERRRADELGRDGRLRRRRPGVGLRPRARGQRPARAAAAGRLRLPGHQQPAAARGRSASTYKLAASGPRPRHDQQRRLHARSPGGTGALPHTVPITVIAGDEDTTACTRGQHEGRRRGRGRPARAAARGRRSSRRSPSRRPPSSVLGSTPGPPDRGDVRADRRSPRSSEPLRFCNRYVSAAAARARTARLVQRRAQRRRRAISAARWRRSTPTPASRRT